MVSRGCLTVLVCGVALLVWIRPTAAQNEEALWRHRNLGRALFESPARIAEAPAELKQALDLAPHSFRERLNYGLALLRAGDTQNGVVELERAQQQDPEPPHTWFNLGIAYKRQGRYIDAIRQFEGMIRRDPSEAISRYNLGMLYNLTNRPAEALEQFRMSAKIDPNIVAPRYQIYNYSRLRDDSEAETERALADFQEAKNRQQAADETEDTEWCVYAELYDPLQARRPAAQAQSGPPRFRDRRLAGRVDAQTAGVLPLDTRGDGRPDLLVWSSGGIQLYRGARELVRDSGLAGVTGVTGVAAGDFDNDGLPDLCVLTATGARIYHNEKGRFAAAAVQLPAGRFRSAVWLDFDHDYDVDLFLLGPKPALLRNQGGGRFEDYTAHFPFAEGDALDAVAFRALADSKALDLAVSYADRGGVLYRDRLVGVFEATSLEALPAGAVGLRAVDTDGDGQTDLVFSTPRGASIAANRDGRFAVRDAGPGGAFVFTDLENRGAVELVRPGREWAAIAPWPAAGGEPALAAVGRDGSVHLLTSRAVKHPWVRVALTGVKNLKMAPGAEVEVRAGDAYQKKTYEGVPLVFGLGTRKQADTVRITWPNGMIQNQTEVASGRTSVVKEGPRLAGSCPMIFTWNGHAFEFITDVLGVAPLGASSSDGEYFPVDHDEYVQIPGEALAPAGGGYDVRITEELHEVSYLDQVRLIAVDHPREIEVFTNEKFKSPPFPEFRLFGVERRIYPAAARDDAGRDVLPALKRRDGVYALGFRHDSAGVAESHALTLDFGPGAARENRAVLLLNGWVDWADGSTFLGASQAPGGGLVFPFLQVKDAAGEWRTVIADMGIPSGKPKTIAVDLSGKFLSASREVRIVTNLCVYWDEVFLSESAAAPPVRMTPLDAMEAVVGLRGFSRVAIDPRREQPEAFDYAQWTSSVMWNQTPGFYTRYGDVRELVLAPDDRFVIMGSGDELRLRFPAGAVPPLPAGWRRDFLLLVDGWAKDGDANTAYSQSVEPLPFHGMSRYPYPAAEQFPTDPVHREYRETYNTRPAIRFHPPLVTRR